MEGMMMKNVFKSLAVLAASLLTFSACNQEVLPVEQTGSHTFTFVAKAPQTKTSVAQDGSESVYSWSANDVDRLKVYQVVGTTYTKASSVEAEIDSDSDELLVSATFESTPADAQYIAFVNSGVKSEQNATDSSYDQDSDVLVSAPVEASAIINDYAELCFKRETAFALMTAKGLDGDYMLGASLAADKALATSYDYKSKAFDLEHASKSVSVFDLKEGVYEPISLVESGNSTVFFATVPVEDAALKVAVVTGDEDGKFLAAYEKTFAEGRTISFERGGVRPFNVSGFTKVSDHTLDLTTDQTTTATADELSWDESFVSVVSAKVESGTAANNYYPGKNNYTSTRFYRGNTLTFTPKLGISVKEIVYTATTDDYATALANSTWTNATVSAAEKTVTITPADGTKAVSVVMGATTGANVIVIKYGVPVQPTTYSVTIDPAIENGTVTATPSSNVKPGTEVTLTATPDEKYRFASWNVTAGGEKITVANNKFIMPDDNVVVSATFELKPTINATYTIALNNSLYGISTGNNATEQSKTTSDGVTVVSGCVSSATTKTSYQEDHIRYYSGSYLKISAPNGALISSIVFAEPSSSTKWDATNTSGISVDEGTYTNSSKSWSGSADKVTFSFSAQCRIASITVAVEGGKTLKAVTVSGTPTKTSYFEGDSFDPAGLTVTGTYDDESQATITDGITWSKPAALTVGQTSVSITATVKDVTSDAYTVNGLTVQAVAISSISVKTAPTKVDYTEGESFDPTGLVITRLYNNNTNNDYAYAGHESEFSFSPALTDPLATTDTKVTITYLGQSVDQAITVKVSRSENEFFYESFDTNNGTGGNDNQWSGSIASSDIKQDNDGWVFENASGANECAKFGASSKLGSATTPALGQACNAKLTFKAAAWNGNSESTTLKLSVLGGGTVSPATVTMAKGAWTDFEVTLEELTESSKIKFEGEASANSRFFLDEVSVVKTSDIATLESVTVSGEPTKKSYYVGDSFDPAGLVATAKFDDESTKDVTADATWTVTPETLTAGTTSVKVTATYKTVTSAEKTVSGLTVTEPATLSSISVKTAPAKVTYTEGDNFDPTGLVIYRHYSDDTQDEYAYAGHTSEFSFNPALTAALATTDTKVTITYQDKTVEQVITVEEKQIPTFASLEELAAADLASETIVKVSFENVEIKKIYVTNNGYRNGIYFDIQKGGKDIEIFYQNVPEEWLAGGTVSGTMTCPWKNYYGTWELAPDQNSWDWANLTYKAPLVPCATPVITISDAGSATITCETDGASIYYTVGESPSDPTNASTLYTGAVSMTDGQTIKAIAYNVDKNTPSAVASKKYTKGGSSYTTKQTVTYKQSSSSAASVNSGTAPSGSSVTFSNTYSTKDQLTSGKVMTLTLKGYANKKITGLTLSMKSNAKAGAGYLSFTAGANTLASIGSSSSGVAFNNASWNGSYTTTYTDVTITMSDATHIVADGEDLVITIGATTNSLYCQSFTIEYYE